jgi:hypothetical protein
MNYIRFIKFLRSDFEISNNKYTSIKFFRSQLVLIFVWLWVLERYYAKELYNVEELIQNIPKEHASRPTIYKFIDLSIKKNFLKKINSSDDKRKRYLEPTKQTVDEFEIWAQGFINF